MMSIRAFGDNTLYVSFPNDGHITWVPPDVNEWLTENKIDDWGTLRETRVGVFLSGEDAVAFKLKFSL